MDHGNTYACKQKPEYSSNVYVIPVKSCQGALLAMTPSERYVCAETKKLFYSYTVTVSASK